MVNKILAVDIGTSSTKAVLFDQTGGIAREAEAKHPVSNPAPGYHEQDPLDWWRSMGTAIRQLGSLSDVVALTFSGTMQNVIALGEDGLPLRPAILYGDSRASAQFERLAPTLTAMDVPRIIGNRPNEFMAAFKIRWMLENEPDLFERTHIIHSGAKDYIIWRMTGEQVTDPTAATTVGVMALDGRHWHTALLRLFGLPMEKLPSIRPSRSVVGTIRPEVARELGLPSAVQVINGIGDAGASTIGAGVTEPGQAYVYLGTTAWVARAADLLSASLPRRTFALAHSEPGHIIEVAPLLSGGDCVDWLLGTFGTDLAAVGSRMSDVDASPPELMFLPYLKGERSPFIDTSVRGGFLMLDRSHGLPDMFYAVMEGVAFLLRENIDALDVETDTMRLLGGGALSEVWPQIIADVTGRSIEVVDNPGSAPAFGAFCEAAHALGLSLPVRSFGRRISPRAEHRARNEKRRRIFLAATAFARSIGDRAT